MTAQRRPRRLAHGAIGVGLAAMVAALLAGCAPVGSATPAATPSVVARTTSTPTPSISATVEGIAPAGTEIEITIDGQVVTGVLWDNAASRSLIAQLPLTLAFEDHSSLEKIGELPQELSMEGMPEGDDPQPNDIGYYAPSSDLVFYYGDVDYWGGIARIGEFTSDISPIQNQNADFTATIEMVE